jgi:3-hydroxybutyryl-CoA dehydratase
MTYNGVKMNELKYYEEKIIITEDLIQKFANFSSDFNPVHFDDEAAIAQGFKGRIAHGMLTASLFSGVLANKFPGPGTIYLNQTFKFHAPIYLNDQITLKLELVSVKEGKAHLHHQD